MANAAKPIALPGEPKHVYAIQGADGKVEFRSAQPEPIQAKAISLDTLVQFMRINKAEGAGIWFSRHGVTGILDRNRRDKIVHELSFADAFAKLCTWDENKPQIEQRELIRTLRTTFRGCMGDSQFLPLIRKLRFQKGESGESEIKHGKASVGKRVDSSVTGEGEIPEEVSFCVPVFDARKTICRIACAVELNAEAGMFQIWPFPMEMENALLKAEADIYGELMAILADAGEKIPVYYGTTN